MIRRIFLTILIYVSLSAAGGDLRHDRVVKSANLGRDVRFSLYLPTGYDSGEGTYPILYLLNGRGGDNHQWEEYGILKTTDSLIAAGAARAMIIVMPDGMDSWYTNSYDGRMRYEDMFFEELVPFVEGSLRVAAGRENRAIAGLSMGGRGALLYSLKHSDMFCACGALSSTVLTDDDVRNRVGSLPGDFPKLYGSQSVDNPYFRANSILWLTAQMADNEVGKVRFWVDCGDDDFLFRGNSTLYILMRDKKIPVEYRVRNGEHNDKYWSSGIGDILQFIFRK